MTHPALHCTFSSNAIFTLFTLSYISHFFLTLLLQWNTKGDVLNNATGQKKVLQVWDVMTERKFLDLFLWCGGSSSSSSCAVSTRAVSSHFGALSEIPMTLLPFSAVGSEFLFFFFFWKQINWFSISTLAYKDALNLTKRFNKVCIDLEN